MKQIVIPYRPREIQKFLHKKCDVNRFNVIIVHRRGGKTVFAINHLIKAALTNKKPYPRYAFLSPYRLQGKSTAWDYMKQFSAAIPGTKFNESELRVDFSVNNSRIQIIGAENSSAIRGQYFDGVIVDETQNIAPDMFDTILRPCLSDRKGFAIFIGTPMGRNWFFDLHQRAKETKDWFTCQFKASETKIIPQEELDAAKATMSVDAYEQEFECSWVANVPGAIYGKELQAAQESGRIGNVPYDQAHKVDTWWDLGIGDSTAIWFTQNVGRAIHVIDFYEARNEGLPHYAKILTSKSYLYGNHNAPHDIEVRELGSGKSRREVAYDLGINFRVVPKLPVEDGIHAAQLILSRCWFDQVNCKAGLEALRQYHRAYNERLRTFRNSPVHDWASHAADAWRYFAVGVKENRGFDRPPQAIADSNYNPLGVAI